MSKPAQLNPDGSYTADPKGPGGLFRSLTAEEVKDFQAAAREKHVTVEGSFPQIRYGIFHPVYTEECKRIENEWEAF